MPAPLVLLVDRDEDTLEAARSVADEVLLKPVRPRAVVAAVSRLLAGDPV
jgi:DNA-binding response OmpR family regulator